MTLKYKLNLLLLTFFTLSHSHAQNTKTQDSSSQLVTKVKDFVIYEDEKFYSSFPSIIKKMDGEYLLAFRRAPNRKGFGEKGNNHVDPNSYLVGLRSMDGENWSSEPELIYAHAFGGSQDPCLIQLKDGSILCASYGWAFLRPDAAADQQARYFNNGPATFLGGYLLRSTDWAKSWQGPIYPPSIQPEININPLGDPIPAYNRGAMYEGKDGRVFWVVAASDSIPKKTSTHLIVSEDKGLTWTYQAPVTVDERISFNEASIYETPKGDLVAFVRTAGLEDQAVIARSSDGGKSFQWPIHGIPRTSHAGYPVTGQAGALSIWLQAQSLWYSRQDTERRVHRFSNSSGDYTTGRWGKFGYRLPMGGRDG